MTLLVFSIVSLLGIFVGALLMGAYNRGYAMGRKHGAQEGPLRPESCSGGQHTWRYVHASSDGNGLRSDYRCVHCGDWEQRGE